MPLLKAGFSLADVEQLSNAADIRTFASVIEEVQRQARIERLLDKLDMAEAMNAALIGSTADKQKRNQQTYARWLHKVESDIMKLQGQPTVTIWSDIQRKSRRIGR